MTVFFEWGYVPIKQRNNFLNLCFILLKSRNNFLKQRVVFAFLKLLKLVRLFDGSLQDFYK